MENKEQIKNEMMDRPVINADVRSYLRENLPPLTGYLHTLQKEAEEKRIPVIPHETVAFLRWLLPLVQPQSILEIGTAIGFSAALLLEAAGPESQIVTIERNPQMYTRAQRNLEKMELDQRAVILKGQAEECLKELDREFDFIFMDSAKAKYDDFFPQCMRLLKKGGVLAVDDVLQGGTITDSLEEIPRRRRKIHKKLNLFLDKVFSSPYLTVSLVPVGDGLLLVTKKEEHDFSDWIEES